MYTSRYRTALLRYASTTIQGLSRAFNHDDLAPGSNKRGILADAVQDEGDEELAERIRSGLYGIDWHFAGSHDADPRPEKGADLKGWSHPDVEMGEVEVFLHHLTQGAKVENPSLFLDGYHPEAVREAIHTLAKLKADTKARSYPAYQNLATTNLFFAKQAALMLRGKSAVRGAFELPEDHHIKAAIEALPKLKPYMQDGLVHVTTGKVPRQKKVKVVD